MTSEQVYKHFEGLYRGSKVDLINDKLYLLNDKLESLYESYLLIRQYSKCWIYFKENLNFKVDHNSIPTEYCFINCFFESNISLNKSSSFKNRYHSLLFEECKFSEGIEIMESSFKSLSFIKSIITSSVLIKDLELEKDLFFYNCSFNSELKVIQTKSESFTLVKCHIQDKLTLFMLNLSSNSIIKLGGTYLNKGLDISEIGTNNKITLFGLKINEFEILKKANINIKELKNRKGFEYVEECIYSRESYRILKSELKNQNNIIDSLRFERLEKLFLKKELEYKIHTEKRKSKNQSKHDLFLILFGELSNKNGTSFARALIFIFLTAFFATAINLYIYYLNGQIISDFSSDGTVYVIKYFLSFFNLTDWSGNSLGLKEYPHILILTFFFKILMTIGIYQFIQAARKWSSK